MNRIRRNPRHYSGSLYALGKTGLKAADFLILQHNTEEIIALPQSIKGQNCTTCRAKILHKSVVQRSAGVCEQSRDCLGARRSSEEHMAAPVPQIRSLQPSTTLQPSTHVLEHYLLGHRVRKCAYYTTGLDVKSICCR